ncbi:transcriptional regulator [Hydrocoleum sp. CS-953]|uniref:heavy metal-responsive transcriptional regulator n=1 Tax=Hydrocoleum sp. CS-953 TaxID=1671698 RepID=UPI000B9A652C|nr:heavy metal-responsive transcriptional regulator [Hydrocoleum sp. CS-953]OZH51919.1 transcriptional regulator [Hydrocoleum sp. CS-953]
MKIGQVAAVSGLPIKTIRYYEDMGLLKPSVERSQSGYRLFEESVLGRLSFIKRAKSLGLSLREISEILVIRDRGELPCREVKQKLASKVQEITSQIEALENLKGELQEILQHWQEEPSTNQVRETVCPNIQAQRYNNK